MDNGDQNISSYRKNKIKEYIIFSYIISLLMLSLMFKDHFSYIYSHIVPFNIFLVLIFSIIILLITKHLKNKKVLIIPSWEKYIKFILLVTCFSFLIYINKSFHINFLKIYYLIPIIISTVSYGRKMGFYISLYSSFNLLLITYISQNNSQLDIDILIIILFFWIVWLIGGLIDLEREIQTYLKDIINEEKKLKREKEINLEKSKEMAKRLKEINIKLKKSQKLFKLNFEKSSIGMAICDIKLSNIKTNLSLSNMLGYNKEEIRSFNYTDIIYKDDLADFKKLYRQMLNGYKSTHVGERRMITKNNNIIWVRENITLARSDNNKPLYFLKQIENITEKKQAEKQIQEQRQELEYNKIKRKFFAKVSHELKTPLNLIFTALHMLLENSCSEDEKIGKFLYIIKQNSYRLLRLVNNVIDLTKMDLNNFKIKKINIDIVKTVKKITYSTREYVKDKNRILLFKSDLEKQIIACDPFNIERILLNLISNAVKFTEAGDKIIVNIRKINKNILISVHDTGIGIKEKHLKLIFNQFRQVDDSFTKKAEGSGIGLSIVKSLVELHEGRIWVESEFGTGSTFFIELPIKTLDGEENQKNKNKINANLMDKVNVEFSDIYNLN